MLLLASAESTTALRPRRRLALLLAVAAFLYTQRSPLIRSLRYFLRALSRFFRAADALTGALDTASTDLQNFLSHPLPPQHYSLNHPQQLSPHSYHRPLPYRGTNRHDHDHDAVPRSVRRLLKVAAAPESLAILRALSGGAAQGVVRELARDDGPVNARPAGFFGIAVPAYPGTGDSPPPSGSIASKLFAAMQFPGGEKMATAVVSAAVREALTTTFDHCIKDAAKGEGSGTPLSTQLLDLSVTPRGKQLLSDLLTVITRTTVPIILQQMSQPKHESALTPQARPVQPQPASDRVTRAQQEHTAAIFPTNSKSLTLAPRSRAAKNPGSDCDSDPSAEGLNPPPAPPTLPKQLPTPSEPKADGVAAATNKLFLLAQGADKDLLRDMVRTVASEAVRSYLTTQADLRAHRRRRPTSAGSGALRNSPATSESGDSASEEMQQQQDHQAASDVQPRGMTSIGDFVGMLLDFVSVRGEHRPGWFLF